MIPNRERAGAPLQGALAPKNRHVGTRSSYPNLSPAARDLLGAKLEHRSTSSPAPMLPSILRARSRSRFGGAFGDELDLSNIPEILAGNADGVRDRARGTDA
jgi:hypothetical protein